MSAIIMRSQLNRVRFPSIRDPHAHMAIHISPGHENWLFSPGSQKIAYPECVIDFQRVLFPNNLSIYGFFRLLRFHNVLETKKNIGSHRDRQ